jgi:lactoylglutathione lyase
MRLGHTMLRVKDLDASLAFYQSFLGMHEVRRSSIGNEATLVFLTDESGRYFLELTYNHGRSDYTLGDQFGHLAFLVDDLEAVVREVESKGWWYRRSRPEMSSRYIFVKDPSGYDIEILESRARPAN